MIAIATTCTTWAARFLPRGSTGLRSSLPRCVIRPTLRLWVTAGARCGCSASRTCRCSLTHGCDTSGATPTGSRGRCARTTMQSNARCTRSVDGSIAEDAWPPTGVAPHRLLLTDDGLRPDGTLRTPRPLCSPQTVGKHAGEWCPFGRSPDQAGDQREDDARSLVFESTPLEALTEILGAAIVTLDIMSDQPIANLAVRLCNVHPTGVALRVSYGVLNLTHRDGHETPSPLVVGQRYQVRVLLNDAGAVFPVGHKRRLALSTTDWPMIWPSPLKATLTIFCCT